MKHRLDPNRGFIIIAVVLAIIIRLPAIWCQEIEPYVACNQTDQCGGDEFDYPFWGLGRPSYCGHPGFRLTCQSGVPELEYESVYYRVLDTDTSTQTIKVARNDLWSTICPQYLHNTTYDQAVLNGDNFGQQNVSIYYRCNTSVAVPELGDLYQFRCNNINGTDSDSYFTITDRIVPETFNSVVQCNNHIIVPVNRSSAERIERGPAVESDLRSALTAGFDLQWTANNNLCDQCIRSDGKCGSNSTSPNLFACYCANGNFSLTCNDTNPVQGKENSSSNSMRIVLPVVGAVIVGVGIVLAIFICRQRRKRRAIREESPAKIETKAILSNVSRGLTSDNSNFTSSIPSYPSSKTSKTSNDYGKSSYFGAQVFTYEELEVATDNFNDSRELGDGGFGTVYYGKLFDGREVAVKRLYENNFKRVEQFMNEVEILTKLSHENLVKLYGCTSRRSRELLLVYEYIPNGTIADHLHGKLANSSSSLFTWPVRLNIAIQTAEALAYLHKKEIIHRDVKTNNILLDKSFQVKVADFGLSRLFPTDVTHVSTAPQGTPGYVDPEYYQCYQLTVKSDVYSFGVVLIELISSLQAVDTSRDRLDINLANMAMTKIQTHMLDELVDKSIGFETNAEVRRMITLVAELAFRCLQQEKDMRPTMNEVVEVLRGIQNDELNVQKPEVLDIVVDDGGLLKDHKTELSSPDSRVTNKLVKRSLPNSSDG